MARGRQTIVTAAPSMTTADAQEVAQVAYALYEERGRADGHDLEDWLKAEAIVRQRRGDGRPRWQ